MTDSYSSMKSKLSATGLYRIEKGSNVSNELCAYSKELDLFYSELDSVLRECFIQTAKDYGLSRREAFSGREGGTLPTEKRREILLLTQTSKGFGFTPDGFKSLLKSYSLSDFEFVENPSGYRLTVRIYDNLSEERKEAVSEIIDAQFPYHLNIIKSFLTRESEV